MNDNALPPARLPKDEHLRPGASTFDRLIDSNLQLTANVGKLVRLSWAIILLNVVLIVSVALLLGWTALRLHALG